MAHSPHAHSLLAPLDPQGIPAVVAESSVLRQGGVLETLDVPTTAGTCTVMPITPKTGIRHPTFPCAGSIPDWLVPGIKRGSGVWTSAAWGLTQHQVLAWVLHPALIGARQTLISVSHTLNSA